MTLDEIEQHAEYLYRTTYLNKGHFGIHKTHDEELLIFHGRTFDHAFYTTSVRIPMMSISRSEVMAISAERSDARLFQCESVIDIRQGFCRFSLPSTTCFSGADGGSP